MTQCPNIRGFATKAKNTLLARIASAVTAGFAGGPSQGQMAHVKMRRRKAATGAIAALQR